MQTFISSKDILSLNTKRIGGAERDRTADPLLAKQVLSQLSYSPNHRKHLTANRQDQVTQTNHNSPQQIYLLGQMVGPGRLELPTPRLSSVCSNQLSYGPISLRQHLIRVNLGKGTHTGQRPSPVVRRPRGAQHRRCERRASANPWFDILLKKEKRGRRKLAIPS